MGGIARGRGVITAGRANHDEAGFGSTAARPKAALSGAGGAGAAEGRSTAASEQTRMACYRTAIESHAAKKGCSGAGGAGAAEGRVVSGPASEQTRTRDVERADRDDRMQNLGP